MNRHTLTIYLVLFFSNFLFSQCNLDFGSSVGQFIFSGDIVNGASSGANVLTSSFNIWDESIMDCSTPGGGDDITFDFEIINAFDQYNVNGIIDQYAGITHDIIQSPSGFQGSIPLGNSGTNETSSGDVRGYQITVKFTSGVIIEAQNIEVLTNSVNTAGSAFESGSVVFLDETFNPYGTATYEGFYGNGSAGPSITGCTVPASGTAWSMSGTGVYTMGSISTVDVTDPCNIAVGSNGPDDNNKIVHAVNDAGLMATDRVGGFVFTVYFEDIAASNGTSNTTTSAKFSSTLKGVNLSFTPLPVELTAFSAKTENNTTRLDWKTASEINNDYFSIEHSCDGRNFESVGEVNGIGTTTETQRYSFIHKSPKQGDNYYRLKQIDFDGGFEYSEIKVVRVEKATEVQVFPTIASTEISVIIRDEFLENSQLAIFNSMGQMVKIESINGATEFDINIKDLAKGHYYLQLRNGSEVVTKRFIKQ